MREIHQVFVYSDVPAIVLTNVLRIVSIREYISFPIDSGKTHRIFVYSDVPPVVPLAILIIALLVILFLNTGLQVPKSFYSTFGLGLIICPYLRIAHTVSITRIVVDIPVIVY